MTGYGRRLSGSCLFILILLFSGKGVGAESLWAPGFPGYAAEGGGYGAGDIVSVVLSVTSSLSLDSVQKHEDSTRMSFSGNDAEKLVAFLPSAQSGADRSMESGQDLTMSAVLAARITGSDASGALTVRGLRQIVVNGSLEQISVEGSVMPQDIIDGRVLFEKMADARLVFDTNAYPSGEVLREGDIVYTETPPALPPPTEAAANDPENGAGETETGTAPVPPSPQIEEERQRELLREYMNRFLQLLFSTEAGSASP